MKLSVPLLVLVLFAILLAPLPAAGQTVGPVQPAVTAASAQVQPHSILSVKVMLQSGSPGEKLRADLQLTDATVTLYAIAGQNAVYSREAKPNTFQIRATASRNE